MGIPYRSMYNKKDTDRIRKLFLDKKLFLLDGDGTLYLWDKAFKSSPLLLKKLIELKKNFVILSNNDSESKEKRLKFVSRVLKTNIQQDNLLLPNDIVEDFLQKKHIKRFDGLISSDFAAELNSKGFILDKSDPEIVLVGFDVNLTYAKLKRVINHISNGKKFLLTHNDPLCPYKDGREIPDAGSIVNLITLAVKKEPDYRFGKPFVSTIDYVIKKYGFKREDMLIIGDRLNTDIKMANENEISSIWVTNNLKDPEKELKGSGYKPDVTIDSIALLYKAVHNI